MSHSRIRSLPLAAQFVLVIFMIGFAPNVFVVTAAADADISQIQASAKHGNIREQIALADAYFSGHGVKQDLKMAAFWYEKAAGSGDPIAQNEIGYLYQVGLGVRADEARAVHWFQLAAAGGFLDAKVNLGVAYMWGAGVPKDPNAAGQLIREAAEKGSDIGATYLGDMYYFGVGVTKDEAAAKPWYERGAKLHNRLAAFRLGGMILAQKDHPEDMKRAVSLYREAASGGFVPAMHALGLLLVNHPELNASNTDEAVSLLSRSADAGTWRSSIVLGVLSRDGKMVPHDDKSAYFHFQVAIRQGGDTARDLLSKDLKLLSAKLDPNQRHAIDQEVAAWMQKHNVILEVIYSNGDHSSPFSGFGLAPAPAHAHAAALVPINPS